tara:strand:+ start:3327 stop:4556 length:1230 start_codon:yes stop_codon:yes gene_type:complete
MTEGMMGRTSDTRIYNPRSESSTMFRNNDGDGNYNPGDPKYEEQEKEKKQNAREKQAKKERSRKHIKVRPSMLREFDSDEDGIDDSKKVDADREIHAQTGAAGNFGFLSSLAGGAKGPGAARGEMVAMGEAMDDAWSEILKSKAKDRAKRRKKEAQKKFKPSTGEFKRPVGGYDPKSATSRRAKFKSRALGGKTKRTGLGRAHLAVEMEHRGIKTKQPLRLEDPRKYMQQIGRQQVRVQQGQVRTPASPSIPQISGYSTRGAPRPRLKPMRAPPINPPVIAGAPHLNMSGGTTGMGMGASAPPPPMPIMASEDLHSGSDLQKRMDWFTVQQLRHMLSESKRLLRQKERKRKGKGDADTSGGGTMLPNHPSNGPKQTTRPSGATEDAKNDPRHFGAHTIGNDVGRGGRTA